MSDIDNKPFKPVDKLTRVITTYMKETGKLPYSRLTYDENNKLSPSYFQYGPRKGRVIRQYDLVSSILLKLQIEMRKEEICPYFVTFDSIKYVKKSKIRVGAKAFVIRKTESKFWKECTETGKWLYSSKLEARNRKGEIKEGYHVTRGMKYENVYSISDVHGNIHCKRVVEAWKKSLNSVPEEYYHVSTGETAALAYGSFAMKNDTMFLPHTKTNEHSLSTKMPIKERFMDGEVDFKENYFFSEYFRQMIMWSGTEHNIERFTSLNYFKDKKFRDFEYQIGKIGSFILADRFGYGREEVEIKALFDNTLQSIDEDSFRFLQILDKVEEALKFLNKNYHTNFDEMLEKMSRESISI